MNAQISRTSAFTLLELNTALVIVLLCGIAAVPMYFQKRPQWQTEKCQRNLMEIDAAKMDWLSDRPGGVPHGTIPTPQQIRPYLNHAGTNILAEWPVCPRDPTATFTNSYRIGSMDEPPVCNIMPMAHRMSSGP